MSPSSFFQFIVGFFLGIILFGAGIAGGAYFFLTSVATNPPKHLFTEEKSTPEKKVTPKPEEAKKEESPKPEEAKKEDSPSETEKLPAGAYKAKVTWSTGLSLRAEPNTSAERVGGVGYNAEIIILSTSDDKQWQKVRLPNSGEEGWVKSGNVEKINE
ncbi:SH3 domain-containing protein [Geminocystis herdmanii]|uniref:SH3 domain-containing protein n=1 Tax=Geminocystis herdmanii TaxID=669359 RepID=UPI000344CAC4|nr:SH3 domain-containing protein [Geminocystis herdmanii]